MSTPQSHLPARLPRSRWTGRLAYVATVLLLLELTARVFFWLSGKDVEVYRNFTTTRTPRLMLTDPLLGWRLQPSVTRNLFTSDFQISYRTNSLGLRDQEPGRRDGYDVLFLGDSQTFGEGVEVGQRFSERVGRLLPGVTTLNAGVPGYGLHQMVWLFELEGWRLEPELVVCALIEGDLWRAAAARVSHAGPPQVLANPDEYAWVHPGARSLVRRLERWLRLSYVYAVFSARAKVAWLKGQVAERDRQVWGQITGGQGAAAQADQPDRPAGSAQEALMRETTVDLLTELHEVARLAGAELLVANIDDHSMLWLNSALEARRIPYVDLSSTLRGAPGIRYTIDPHYNARGHELIGARLAPLIRERFDLARRNVGADAETLERDAARMRADGSELLRRPTTSFVVTWLRVEAPPTALPGGRAKVRVAFRNAGRRSWKAAAAGAEAYSVRLGYRWLTQAGDVVRDYGDQRVELPEDLGPGESSTVELYVQTPARPGSYLLQVDLAYEGVAWFEGLGASRKVVPVDVLR